MSEMEFALTGLRLCKDQTLTKEKIDDWYERRWSGDLGNSSFGFDIDVMDVFIVDGEVYEIFNILEEKLDSYGFSVILDIEELKSKTDHLFIGYWYNGGGSLAEVAEQAIRARKKNEYEFQSN